MLNSFFFSTAIISYLLGIPLPDAIQKDFDIVPTVVDVRDGVPLEEPEFQWRLEPDVRTTLRPPMPVGHDKGPELEAGSALVYDVGSKQVLWQKNPDTIRSIASITKLMTALVWLDHQPKKGLDHLHTFAPEQNVQEGKELQLPYGSQITAGDLLAAMLVSSYNDAALAVAATTGLSNKQFITEMNNKADSLMMSQTAFQDQTGLAVGNTSTVRDVIRLAEEAFSKEFIEELSGSERVRIFPVDRNELTVETTDELLADDSLEVLAGKTGYLIEAGYCLVVKAREPETGRTVIAVVLNTKTSDARFEQMKKLLQWTFEHYAWN